MQLYSANYPQSLLAVEQEMHFEAAQSVEGILLAYFWTGRNSYFESFKCLIMLKGEIIACHKTAQNPKKHCGQQQLISSPPLKTSIIYVSRKNVRKERKGQREAGITTH